MDLRSSKGYWTFGPQRVKRDPSRYSIKSDPDLNDTKPGFWISTEQVSDHFDTRIRFGAQSMVSIPILKLIEAISRYENDLLKCGM